MEEEEEREREESFRLAGAPGPWPTKQSSSTELRDEARDLDRAMEERVVLRRKSSVASSSVNSSGVHAGNGPLANLGAWKSRMLGGRRSRTQSAASSGTARSVSMVSVEEEGSMDMEVQLESESNSDADPTSPRMALTTPLSANTNSTGDANSAPITPLSLPFKAKHGLGLKSVDRDMDLSDVQIVVQDVTPMAHRLGTYEFSSGTSMSLDSPMSPSLASGFPNLPTARPPLSPRSSNIFSGPPPPSASHLKISFDHTPPPPPAQTLRKPSSMSKLLSSSSRRSSRASRLEPVPSSPVASSMATTTSSIGVHSIETIIGRPAQRRRFSRSSSTSSRRSISPDVPRSFDVQEATTTKPKPIPSPLTFAQSENHPSYVLSGSLTTESSSHRTSSTTSSASSSSSHSSSSAAKRFGFRQRLLSRTKPPSQDSGPSASTPHQTLFIFPPSPTQNAMNAAPSMTPSALMLTTDRQSLLTPTPTLANFRRVGEMDPRNRSRKSSASSSASSRSSGGGWVGVVPSTPTTACSRVDAKGWVAR